VQFVHDTSVSPEKLWNAFAFEHATIPVLVGRFHLSEKTIRTRLESYVLPEHHPKPRTMVAIIDCTKAGRSWILAIRDPHAKENVYVREVPSETTSVYQTAYADCTDQGFIFVAIVSDGRFVGSPWLFPGIPIQMCHFHMEQIVIRYTTLNPNLEAGKELLELIRTLTTNDGDSFTDAFNFFCRTWDEFLKEKTVDPITGRWHWTHKRIRAARDSVRAHLPFLFTFERHPDLHIPNTTNSLDGSFKKVKLARGIHSGLTHKRQIKLMMTILFGRE
jgi:hypothetical protein